MRRVPSLAAPYRVAGAHGAPLAQAFRPPGIFSAGAGHDRARAAGFPEGADQREARRDPVEIGGRAPVQARLGVPGEVQQVARLDGADDAPHRRRVQQVHRVEGGLRGRRPAAEGVDREAAGLERRDRMGADEPGRPGEENPPRAHAHTTGSAPVQAGKVRSRSAITATGSGQVTASAGSSQRRPRAASAT